MKRYDILFLSEKAIGNTIEMLYAVEYCLANSIKVGIYIKDANLSFKKYLQECYGKEVILDNYENIIVENLVHTFIVNNKLNIKYKNYLYIKPDVLSTQYKSETEQYLDVVKAIYPSSYDSKVLTYLREDYSDRVRKLDVENKYVIYPGCSPFAAARRWPYYEELILKLGLENTLIVGGKDELNDEYAYKYKKFVPQIFPRAFTNRKIFWDFCKKINLLEPYAHNKKFEKFNNAYFNIFSWGELVSIFRRCKGFIGNDGGLMHLASASGARGIAIFGPSSVNKSRSYNPSIKEIYKQYECQPCFFEKGDVVYRDYCITCPYNLKCLSNIKVKDILDNLKEIR